MIVNATPARLQVVALVRDPEGNPRFDDPHNVSPKILEILTIADRVYLEKLKLESPLLNQSE